MKLNKINAIVNKNNLNESVKNKYKKVNKIITKITNQNEIKSVNIKYIK